MLRPLFELLQSGDAAYSHLYNSYNVAADLKSLTIYAETLVIRSPLSLPGTNVKVYARELIFEDLAGQPTASLNTAPLPLAANNAPSSNGQAGQRAGDVSLLISNFLPAGNTVRLIATGGRGQDAGQGQEGARKSAYTPQNKGSSFTITVMTEMLRLIGLTGKGPTAECSRSMGCP